MKCRYCGQEVNDKNKYCPNCGSMIAEFEHPNTIIDGEDEKEKKTKVNKSINDVNQQSTQEENKANVENNKIDLNKLNPDNAPVPADAKTNGLAIAGFIISLVACCLWFFSMLTYARFACAVVGIVLSSIGMSQTKIKNQKGRGFAIAGLIIGIIAL